MHNDMKVNYECSKNSERSREEGNRKGRNGRRDRNEGKTYPDMMKENVRQEGGSDLRRVITSKPGTEGRKDGRKEGQKKEIWEKKKRRKGKRINEIKGDKEGKV